MADKTASNGEPVRDVRLRNRSLKFLIIGLVLLLLVIAVACILYFCVFAGAGEEVDSNTSRIIFTPESKLILFKQGDEPSAHELATEVDEFIKTYEIPKPGDKMLCMEGRIKSEKEFDIPCLIDVNTIVQPPYYWINYNCSRQNGQYGYTGGRPQPCVALKLSQIKEWVPEPFTNADLLEPEANEMPEYLQIHIRRLNAINSKLLNTTWITCEGETEADKENIGKLGFFYPGFRNNWDDPTTTQFGGIPNNNFPFLEQDAYMSPFVWVKFLEAQRDVKMSIECKAWAKNIKPNKWFTTNKFQLQIDSK